MANYRNEIFITADTEKVQVVENALSCASANTDGTDGWVNELFRINGQNPDELDIETQPFNTEVEVEEDEDGFSSLRICCQTEGARLDNVFRILPEVFTSASLVSLITIDDETQKAVWEQVEHNVLTVRSLTRLIIVNEDTVALAWDDGFVSDESLKEISVLTEINRASYDAQGEYLFVDN